MYFYCCCQYERTNELMTPRCRWNDRCLKRRRSLLRLFQHATGIQRLRRGIGRQGKVLVNVLLGNPQLRQFGSALEKFKEGLLPFLDGLLLDDFFFRRCLRFRFRNRRRLVDGRSSSRFRNGHVVARSAHSPGRSHHAARGIVHHVADLVRHAMRVGRPASRRCKGCGGRGRCCSHGVGGMLASHLRRVHHRRLPRSATGMALLVGILEGQTPSFVLRACQPRKLSDLSLSALRRLVGRQLRLDLLRFVQGPQLLRGGSALRSESGRGIKRAADQPDVLDILVGGVGAVLGMPLQVGRAQRLPRGYDDVVRRPRLRIRYGQDFAQMPSLPGFQRRHGGFETVVVGDATVRPIAPGMLGDPDGRSGRGNTRQVLVECAVRCHGGSDVIRVRDGHHLVISQHAGSLVSHVMRALHVHRRSGSSGPDVRAAVGRGSRQGFHDGCCARSHLVSRRRRGCRNRRSVDAGVTVWVIVVIMIVAVAVIVTVVAVVDGAIAMMTSSSIHAMAAILT
mmetsp:Transcript_7781/g.22563  ORF Transcript_7781/g.22563 Transcript_7781/m.22563 type:complete len:508 (+) Transcript_7781:34-1557(+)